MNGSESPYQKFFWLLVAAAISLIGLGAYTTITLQVNVTNIVKTQDKMSVQLDAISAKHYNSDNAANDRTALMNMIVEQSKLSNDRDTKISAIVNDQNNKITELLIFKAKAEEKLKLEEEMNNKNK